MLSKEQSPKNDYDVNAMNVHYYNIIGPGMYLMICTRPNIAYTVRCLSRYISNPGMPHGEALKWLLIYLKSTMSAGLDFSKSSSSLKLIGYVRSNHANDRDNREPATSYVFILCSYCINWKFQIQHIGSLSTTESEYVVAAEALKEALFAERTFI